MSGIRTKNDSESDERSTQKFDVEAQNLTFPFSKIKKIIDEDQDIKSISRNAVIMISSATVSEGYPWLGYIHPPQLLPPCI